MIPRLAATSHSSPASATVRRDGVLSLPRRSATWASWRQRRASPRVLNVFRSGFRSLADQAWAWKLGVHEHAPPEGASHRRPCLTEMPGVLRFAAWGFGAKRARAGSRDSAI